MIQPNPRPRNFSGSADGAGACTEEWLQRLQLQLGGAFTWATNESQEGFSINNERFVISGLLGEGSFGSVYRCSCEGHQVAVKILSTERIAMMTNCPQPVVLRRMLQEAEILGCLGGHPNIVQLRCAAVSQETLRIYIVMQLLECSDLFTEMLRRRAPFVEKDAREAVSQLVMAVMHCHRRGVAHRDIKLENVMVASVSPLVIKLIDFGQAIMHDQRAEQMQSMAKTLTTTSVYTPPEVKATTADGSAYDALKLDCFAVGVVLYAMMLSDWPNSSGKNFEKHPKWKHLSSGAQDLLRGLLAPDPEHRLTVAEALQHPWLCQKSSAGTRSVKSLTPMDRESEMQVLLSAQHLNKALQRERGSTCWLISGHADAESACVWFRKSTDESFESMKAKLVLLQLECVPEIAQQLQEVREFTDRLRLCCHFEGNNLEPLQKFDEVFSGFCKLNEEVIHLIGQIMVAIKGGTPSAIELKIRLLLDIAEQLGRERGFMSFHIGRPELRSVGPQLRFAKIQGCRQYLVGSSCPYKECEIVSTAEGLLPSLRLAEEPVLSREEIMDLETAEESVMQGEKGASEWFAFLTGMIDKVHQQVSMGVVLFIQDLLANTQDQLASLPSVSSPASSPMVSLQGSRETLGWGRPMGPMGPMDAPVVAAPAPKARTISPTGPMSPERYVAILEAASALQQEEFVPGLGKLGRLPMSTLTPPPFLAKKEHTPVKVIPFGSTPEATPIHPGMWNSGYSSATLYADPAFPPPTSSSATTVPSMPKVDSFASVENMMAVLPPFTPCPAPPRTVVMSKGTIGHPHSCRGLGCKFASKERGCREGSECTRCHLCVWSRASEKEAANQEAANQEAANQQKTLAR